MDRKFLLKWIEQRLASHPLIVPVLLFVGSCLFFSNVYPFNWENGMLRGKDLIGYTYPYFDFIAQQVRTQHTIPLWNPHQLGGFSIIGAGEVNIFYPFNWLTFLGDVRKAITINSQLHVFIGMWGVAFCSQQLGASRLGALTAGLIWGGSGLIGARLHAGHYTLILPLAWFPWVMGSYLRALRLKTWQSGLVAAIPMGLLHLAGHPQVAFITGFMLMGIWFFTVLSTPIGSQFGAATRPLLMIVIVGALLGAIDILPVVDTALVSDRNVQQDRFEFANRFSLPANQLMTFLFPNALGGKGAVRGDPNFEELFAYVGLLPLIATPMLLQRPTKEVWLLICLASLGILLSLAMNGGILRLMIQVIPQLGIFRSAGRWLSLTQLCLSCLTALWITRIQNYTPQERYQTIVPFTHHSLPMMIIALFFLAFGLSLTRSAGPTIFDNPDQLWNVAQIVAKAGLMLLLLELTLLAIQHTQHSFRQAMGALLLVAIVDLWSVTLVLIPVGSPNIYGTFWQNLTAIISPQELGLSRLMVDQSRQQTLNSPTGLGYYDVNGYEQLVADDYNRWIDDQNPLALHNRLLGIQYIVQGTPFDDSVIDQYQLESVFSNDSQKIYIYRFANPIPRAFLAEAVITEPNDNTVRAFFKDEVFGLPQIVLTEQEVACQQEQYGGGQVDITSYTPNQVTIEVEAESPSLLFLSDRFATGWKATVNGVLTPIYRADTIFRAVCVPSGHSEVVFSYHPKALSVGIIFSTVSWSGTVGILGYQWISRRRSAHEINLSQKDQM